MASHSLNVPDAGRKFQYLCAEASRTNRSVIDATAVADELGVSASRITQVWGGSNPSGVHGVSGGTLGLLVDLFNKWGVPVTVVMMTSSYDEFASALSAASFGKAQPAASGPVMDEQQHGLPSAQWSIPPPKVFMKLGLAGVRLHHPRPLNSRPDCYLLDVSLTFETVESSEANALIALKNATLVFESNAYQLAHNSLLGCGARPCDYIALRLNGIFISSSDEGPLVMDPLGGAHLAVIEPLESDTRTVAVQLEAGLRSFSFSPLDEAGCAPEMSAAKDAILNIIYAEGAEMRPNSSGRYPLARATMQRRPQ